jgi:LuxR family maltose regulon positive regulatory protein
VTAAFSPALILLTRLENFAQNCRRTLDQLEALVLKAVILWNDRQRERAVDTMRVAVFIAQPCGYIRIFSNEGSVVIPILQKLYNRLSGGQETLDMAVFVRSILIAANETALIFPGIANSLEEKPAKLSKQQARMLQFLAAGKNNRQICEETGLKLNTVKAHLHILYEKLDVNSATDAVIKANRLGILRSYLRDKKQ